MTEHINKVELLGYYGGDLMHAASAWTSTTRDIDAEKLTRIDKLLKHLADNDHGTPFEKSSLHFLVTCDLSSHIHLLKHRIGVSINAESARYKELKDDKFYIPVDWDEDEQTRLIRYVENSLKCYHETLKRLTDKGVTRKRAKESARFYLPYANQLTCDVMFNFRSFMHFQRLRNSEHAQLEIMQIANAMLSLVENIEGAPFAMSIRAFNISSHAEC
jgi:thymidylate synthase (FAD)